MPKFINFVLALAALGVFAACTPSHIDLNEGDAATSADSTSSADSTASGRDSADTAPAPTTCQGKCGVYDQKAKCQCDAECGASGDCCGDYASLCKAPVNNCTDSDGDGYCGTAPKQGDCNDGNANINPGMPEKCGDGIDNNCNGTADEGCSAPCVPVTEVCADGKDNDCDGQVDEGCVAPCVPTNEVCGDSKDNDCDGQIDEGCTAPTGYNTLTVTYPESAYRRLSYGITPDTSFEDWKPQSWTMNASLTVDLGNPQQGNCFYLRFNVDQPQGWLCMGNTTTVLNPQAVISANLFGKAYNTSDVKKVPKDGGCSAYILVAKPGASCPTP